MKRYILLLSALLLSMMALCQQPTKTDLERERAAIKRDIDELNASLKQTAKNKKATLGQLAAVQKKLRQREALINNINKQINLIDGDIYQSNRDIYKLRKELDTLKIQYEKSVVYAYMNRSNYDFLNFLFSSTNFNDALKRVAYLRSYRAYREQQATTIHNTQDALKQKIYGLNENKKRKGEALEEENQQRGVLEQEKNEKNTVVAGLKSREKELSKELTAKRKQDQKLNTAIAEATRRAREEAIREAKARAKAEAPKATVKVNTPATTGTTSVKESIAEKPVFKPFNDDLSRKLSDDFKNNRGSLPWPVESGRISMAFGRNKVEGVDVDYDNHGITIETEVNKAVKAVFKGEVTAVITVGPVQGVIVRHGKYFTTYSNLASVNVSKGQSVQIGQIVGRAADKGDGTADVEFLISDDTDHYFDPEKWLMK